MKPDFEFHVLLRGALGQKPIDRFLKRTDQSGAMQEAVVRVLHERLIRKRARTLGQAFGS